jgi:TonB-linked SusC/RagA family outer membrane protein
MRVIFTFSLLLFYSMIFAQQRTVTGTVTSGDDGLALPGVSVVVTGTTNGTITDINGKYSISVSTDAKSLTFSFIGMESQEIALEASRNVYDVIMIPAVFGVDEVVVTALGIEKKSRGLTYSTQQVKGDELTRTKDVNMINSLAGKSAGVVINKSSSGVGGSSKVIIRGNKSASGNNQPLYVIDGIPMYNASAAQPVTAIGGTNDAGNRDAGDGIGNLNPDDIESINILKGASASALYGSQAANGVIVITTKKGKAGRTSVDFNSNTTFDNVLVMPELQDSYGMSDGGYSWGTKDGKAGHDPKDFFNTGVTTINSISVSSGKEKMQTYFSYANTHANGIIDENKLNKHNFNFRETADLFDGLISLDGSVNLINQTVNNRPTPGGYYFNPLVGLYRFPRGEDINQYKNNFELYNQDRNLMAQNWHKQPDTWEQNPWWLIYRTPGEDVRNRVISSLTAKVKFTDYLNLQARGSADYTADKYEQHIYATTTPALAGSNGNGRFITSDNQVTLLYGDLLLNFNKDFNDFAVTATLGASINHVKHQATLLDSRDDGLEVANVFTLGNMIGIGYLEETKGETEQQSLFGTAQIGYKDYLFLDITGRNDWSSSLAYTNSMNSGFFYPSVGLTAIISDMVSLPEQITFGKVRGSYSKVGNSIPAYMSYPTHTMAAGGSLIYNSEAPFENLEPEMSSSVELGTEWRFFDNMLTFDFTWYKTNTENQFFRLPAPAGSGYSWYYVNAGNIQNKGVEIVLGAHPINNGDFIWKNYFNFAQNKNEVIELHPDMDYFNFGNQTSSSYWMRMTVGGEYGDIYGVTFARDDNGNLILDDNGLPTKSTEFSKIANANPDFTLGWNAQLTYKDFGLSFLIDGRFGGEVISMTQADLDQWGVSQNSADARDAGYVEVDGHKFTDVQGFYNIVGGRDGISEYYVYSATNIRLRELALSYNLPKSVLGSVIKGASISLIGRNLFFIYKDAPYDPDAVMSTGNDLQGVDVFGMPTTRSIGFNIKLSF